jgi:hypothetical protein
MAPREEHLWVVDAIEEGVARVEEDGDRLITVPRYLLPAGAKEGQVLRVARGATRGKSALTLTISIDDEATARAVAKSRASTAEAMALSRKRDRGGDVSL